MKYVDGFVIPCPKKGVPDYQKIAKKAAKVWMEYGALAYYECAGEDMKSGFGIPFPKLAATKPSETVIFAFIVYKSRKHRDAVNKKVMADPRIAAMCGPDGDGMPFDAKRMTYGGFDVIVEGK